MIGYWKFHRRMLDHAVWSLPGDQIKVWITILSKVNHKEGEWFDGKHRLSIEPGSWVTSQETISQAARVGRQTVRTAIKNLLRLESISTKIVTKRYTVITVINWPIYNGDTAETNQECNQALTKSQPSANHNLRMEEGKNVRREKTLPSPSRALPEVVEWGSPCCLVLKYNREAPDNVSSVRSLSKARLQKERMFLSMFPSEEWWTAVFRQYHRSKFLSGLVESNNGHGHFQPDFDWLLSKGKDGVENCVKVHDGRYSDG